MTPSPAPPRRTSEPEARRWKSPIFKAHHRQTSQQRSQTHPLTVKTGTLGSATTTPATTTNGSSSPCISPLTSTSIQSSPDVLPGLTSPPAGTSPTALQLDACLSPPYPPSISSYSTVRSTLNDTTTEPTKGPGLMRRLSQGARNRLRRRTSSNQVASRDRSSGPAMLRRRSNSKNTNDGQTDEGFDSTAELDIQDVPEEVPEPPQGLGLEGISLDGATQALTHARTEGGIGPVVDQSLRDGIKLIKVTKKKKKTLTFILDTDNAKVLWNPQNPAKSFYIDDIQEIRVQADAQMSLESYQIPAEYASRCFTIKYSDHRQSKGRQQKTIYLVAETQRSFDLWTSTLQELSKHRHDLMAGLAGSWQDEKTIRAHWKCEMARIFADRPHTMAEENMDLQSIENLCRSLYIYCSSNMLRAQFDKADTHNSGRLNYEEFKDFVRRLKERKDIRDIYRALISGANNEITLESFLGFLKHSQGVDVDARHEHWVKTFAKYVRKSEPQTPLLSEGGAIPIQTIGLNAFTAFLCSPANNLQSVNTCDAKFDRPLNEYFISTLDSPPT